MLRPNAYFVYSLVTVLLSFVMVIEFVGLGPSDAEKEFRDFSPKSNYYLQQTTEVIPQWIYDIYVSIFP